MNEQEPSTRPLRQAGLPSSECVLHEGLIASSATSMALPGDGPALELPTNSGQDLDLSIAVVEQSDEFAAMREEWNELLSSSTSDCLFLRWEWLYTWWRHFGHDKRLLIITVRSGSRLIAIAPLTVTGPRLDPFPFPLVEFAGAGSIGSDYLDFIIRRSYEAQAVGALVGFLAAKGVSVRLSRVKEESTPGAVLTRELADERWECLKVPTDVCPFIDLSGRSWDSYLGSLGPRHRYNFRRRLRNLQKRYEVRFEYADSEENRRDALRHLVNLHVMRWKQRGGSNAFSHPGVWIFHEELSRLALERGWLRLFVLKLNGEPAAAFYGFRYGGTFHFYQSGFDPRFRQHSVGLVTLGLTIQKAIEEGADEYDLLHGNESYKFLWANNVRRLVRLELYPPGLWGRFQRNTARFSNAAKNFAKRALQSALGPAALTITLD